MKFVKSPSSQIDLPPEVLRLGASLELIHESNWGEMKSHPHLGAWSQAPDTVDAIQVMLNGGCRTVLQGHDQNFTDDVKAWVSLRENPNEYFLNPLKTLLPSGGEFQTLKLLGVQDKEQVRKSILNFSSEKGNNSCVEAMHAVFEELFMNAMIDAPREAKSASLASETLFYLGSDESRLGLACHDHYGSLDIEKLLKRMRKVYEEGAGKAINLSGPGGAGLGCIIMLEKSALICFGVVRGKATVVSCLVYRHFSNKQRTELKKSLHLVIQD